MEKNLLKLQAEIEELREDIAYSAKQAKEANIQWEKSHTKVAQYSSVVESLKNNRKQKEWHEQMVHDLGRTLKKRHESNEWLQNELDQYDQRIAVHQEHKKKQGKVYEKLQGRQKDAYELLRAKDAEQGKYEQQIASHKKEIETRKRLIQETAQTHNVRGYDYDLDDAKIQEFTIRVSKLHKDQSTALNRARQETENELQEVRDALNTLKEQSTILGRDKETAKQQYSANDRKIVSCQSQIKAIGVDEGSKALLEASVQELGTRLAKARGERSEGSWDHKLQEAQAQISKIEDQNDALDYEMAEANNKAKELAELNYLKKETEERQKRLDTLSRAYRSRLCDLLGQQWSPATLETDYQGIFRERTNKVKDAQAQRSTVTNRLERVNMKIDGLVSDIKKAEKDMEGYASHIRNSLAMDSESVEPENYVQGLRRLQEERDIVKSDLDSFAFENDYFSKCLKTLNNKHMCRTCERPVNKPEDKVRLVKKLNDALNRDKKEVEDDFERLENELQRAKDAAPSHNMWQRLSQTDLPQLRSQVKDLEKSRGEVLVEVEGHDRVVENLEQSLRDAESISQPVDKIVKELKDLTTSRAQVEELATKQKAAGLSRTSSEIQKELDSWKKELKGLRQKVSELTEQRERARSRINDLELELSKAKNNLNTTDHQLQSKANIERQVEELQQHNSELKESMKRFDEQVRNLGPRIAEEETKFDDIRQRGSDRQSQLEHRLDQLSDSIHKLKISAQAINAHVAEGGPVKLERCLREIEATQQDISRIEDEQRQIATEINKMNEELGNQETNKRSIEDNIKYRKSQRDLEEVNHEISRLSAQNAEADLAQHSKEADHWARQHDLHSSARTEKLGTMRAKDAEAQRMISEYETDYKDTARRYKEVHIKVEVRLAYNFGDG